MRFHFQKTFSLAVIAGVLGLGPALWPRVAQAQQSTFYLDRLQLPGGPDDGLVMFRPVTQPDNVFFGTLGVGFQYGPLRTNTILNKSVLNPSPPANVIDTQLTIYGSA